MIELLAASVESTAWSFLVGYRAYVITALVAFVLYQSRERLRDYGAKAFAWLGTFRSATTSPAVVVSEDPDIADMAALKRLKARFVRLKCKEGMAAADVCGKEFFTDHGGQS